MAGKNAKKPRGGGDYEAIKSDLRAGTKPGVVAVRHNVPYWKVMYARKQMKDAGEEIKNKTGPEIRETRSDIKQYQCVSNHRFNSNLKQQEAKCPDCGGKVFREIKDGSTI